MFFASEVHTCAHDNIQEQQFHCRRFIHQIWYTQDLCKAYHVSESFLWLLFFSEWCWVGQPVKLWKFKFRKLQFIPSPHIPSHQVVTGVVAFKCCPLQAQPFLSPSFISAHLRQQFAPQLRFEHLHLIACIGRHETTYSRALTAEVSYLERGVKSCLLMTHFNS